MKALDATIQILKEAGSPLHIKEVKLLFTLTFFNPGPGVSI